MIREFSKLNDADVERMLKAPILVCILIAGADGTIDKKEIKEAIAIARKSKKSNGLLTEYFKELSQDFEDKLKITLQSYPYESTQRAPLIVEELSALNKVWPSINRDFARSFYEMLLEIAGKIASSSGGLLGIHKVGSEEARYVNLPMIKPPSR